MLDPMINRRAATAIFLSSVIGLFTAGRIDAGVNHWTTYGPTVDGQSAGVYALALEPRDPLTVYAGVGDYDPAQPNVFFSSLVKTTDGGRSWERTGLNKVAVIGAIAVDPASPDVVFVGASPPPICPGICQQTGPGGLFRSTDGGSSWWEVSGGLEDLQYVMSLVIDPTASRITYAGTWHGAWKSTDGGSTWASKGLGGYETGQVGVILRMDPRDPSVLYASTDGGVFKTTDGMETWVGPLLGAGQSPYLLTGVAIDPSDSSRVWIGSNTGLYRSSDGGASWGPAPYPEEGRTPPTQIVDVQFDPGNPLILYVMTGVRAPLFRSIDGGNTWTAWSDGLRPSYPWKTLAIDAAGEHLYLGMDLIYDLEIPHEPAKVLPRPSAPTVPVSGRP
jgi:photosystem II stability/assembly factor-like uncharacterized protein